MASFAYSSRPKQPARHVGGDGTPLPPRVSEESQSRGRLGTSARVAGCAIPGCDCEGQTASDCWVVVAERSLIGVYGSLEEVASVLHEPTLGPEADQRSSTIGVDLHLVNHDDLLW